jgi:hypothetical protein
MGASAERLAPAHCHLVTHCHSVYLVRPVSRAHVLYRGRSRRTRVATQTSLLPVLRMAGCARLEHKHVACLNASRLPPRRQPCTNTAILLLLHAQRLHLAAKCSPLPPPPPPRPSLQRLAVLAGAIMACRPTTAAAAAATAAAAAAAAATSVKATTRNC